MEAINRIEDLELIEIQKKASHIYLVFRDKSTRKKFELSYKGLLFETTYPALNRKVKRAELSQHVGFKGLTQLRLQDLDPNAYQQLFIEMEGSTSEHKIELIGVAKDFKLKPKRVSEKVH